MPCIRKVTQDLCWVGANDRRLALFENIFPIPRGVSYNAYVLLDEKTVLFDTADAAVAEQFLENVAGALGGRSLDYLVINHMEPDHAALIPRIIAQYPDVKLVGNSKTLAFLNQFFNCAVGERSIVVKEGDTLSTGRHTLVFIMAPMVHWPEAMVSYDATDKILFSADGFGSFGALAGNIFADELDFDRDWLPDARRYYCNIVGKYGPQVQALLKKAAGIEIKMICPLHGPAWRQDLGYILDKYDKWSSYTPEDKAVAIFYASVYGHTAAAAELLAVKLAEAGVKNIKCYDVSHTHVSELIAESFRCSHIVLAAPTYNNHVYPIMENLLRDMQALALQKRCFAIIGNGSWAPQSAKLMKGMVEELKDVRILPETLLIKSALKDEQEAELDAIAAAICADLN